jgi:hypothetical protein
MVRICRARSCVTRTSSARTSSARTSAARTSAAADLGGADLLGAQLDGASLCHADLRDVILEDVHLADANLDGAILRDDFKIGTFRYLFGLYRYPQWALVTDSGEPWVRMGCLFYSLAEWDRIGIRRSNRDEFPDDGSPRSEERIRAFEFARGMALVMVEAWRLKSEAVSNVTTDSESRECAG